ncbi:SDR family NAD(P)-dependent oxidoreductase [Streptomyces sp. AV19]|uniref:SDR family NAD(P)-dependent oxidoreductase n=1 Tax=Streptomyces sp. AV19 TaxID=2793068 RepID=UPI0018FE8374|nr:SDR family NAD(P)-dependent oxidoreductase [Streptomyces sp. AV19]MBH1936595.1 SDR family NAD(P)-dependent oxidoreductase [Streptomyces sp. AV19]MDG4532655.1 SDR family NAD(P)-dependent oxidoreductase [Streptomyces sp. AV19]
MAKTLVVVGAGPGLGMGVARAFGRQGFQVGLVARRADALRAMVGELAGLGVTTGAFPADIRDRDALAGALARAEETLGPVDVLEFSPGPTGTITRAAQTTVESAAAQFEVHVLGAITAVGHVLPRMRARGEGTLLLTTGVSSTVAAPFLADLGLAMAGLRNWAHALRAELGPQGIHVATVTIASGIVPGDPVTDPDVIGSRYYDLYRRRDRAEDVIGDPEVFRALVAEWSAGQG